jgi:hypothetical protein
MACSRLKTLLKKAAARTAPALWQAIAEAIAQIIRSDGLGVFTAAGDGSV